MDTSFDLPDSTDWISTSLASFEPLEAALRCQVCKEFYDTPMITSCSHTFCSLCIRRCITTDGKCPACKNNIQADKLRVNGVVRDIVERFQEARPKALELARKDKEEGKETEGGKKRKLDETDLEEEAPVRQTRSRKTRSKCLSGNGEQEAPIEVPDSEDEGEDGDEFLPDGMARCPVCQKAMKEEHVFPHLDVCPSLQKSGGHNTRSPTNNTFRTSLQPQPKKESSPAQRLPQLNYSLLKDNALRQKLHALGIPTGGNKNALIRRHTEWLNLWNSNCDSTHPKSKKQLLKELDTWDKTQGGNAVTLETKIMKKDFDGKSHATTHKSHFDDLIADARKKRAPPAENKEPEGGKQEDGQANGTTDGPGEDNTEPQKEPQPTIEMPKPYESNEEALATIGEKVEQANQEDSTLLSLSQEVSSISKASAKSASESTEVLSEPPSGLSNPFSSSPRKLPMFQVPQDPIVDMENSTSVR
ncbi:DNA repair protein rad18 [Zopfia rhizophila CBS 207.26]|uniref:Postreplication repair E3 ubiquitin-protein ligase RAD18 n=1 Tax=Zopfia rhizophila CBS 207.26 TaxID=1314779 RepID=A0A6A6EDV1_9PEZI|nr:DNA repair protein rad18 [Zopfia rhizophila CBS 207.26]